MSHLVSHTMPSDNSWIARAAVLFLVLALPLACDRKEVVSESYRVVSHDASSGEWVIVRTNNENHTQVEIRAICDFYKWGDHEPVEGPNSCDLVVGQSFVPNRLKTRPGEFLDVWQSGDTLFITRGDDPGRVHQQFSIRSAKVVQR